MSGEANRQGQSSQGQSSQGQSSQGQSQAISLPIIDFSLSPLYIRSPPPVSQPPPPHRPQTTQPVMSSHPHQMPLSHCLPPHCPTPTLGRDYWARHLLKVFDDSIAGKSDLDIAIICSAAVETILKEARSAQLKKLSDSGTSDSDDS